MKVRLIIIALLMLCFTVGIIPKAENANGYSGEGIVQPLITGCMATTGALIANDAYKGIVKNKPITEEDSVNVNVKNRCHEMCNERFPRDNDGFLECIDKCGN